MANGTLAALGMKLRKALPEPLRLAARLVRHAAGERLGGSPAIPPELIEACRVCASRHALIEKLPKRGRVAEVGTDKGDFAHWILDVAQPSELHLIDVDFRRLRESVRQDRRVTIHPGRSDAMLSGFPDDYFDWIYIDAGHTHEDVSRDAAVAASKVRRGGFLVFNDFAHVDPDMGRYGVHKAVTEFAVRERWPFAWLAYQSNALYDVALRRPDD